MMSGMSMSPSITSIGGYNQGSQETSPMQTTPNGFKKQERAQNRELLIPVTVKMLRIAEKQAAQADDGTFKIHGEESFNALLVGAIEGSPTFEGTRVVFTLNDSTQRVQIQHFFTSEDADAAVLKSLQAGTYVQVVGAVRGGKNGESLHVSSHKTRPIQSADEIAYHLISACHTALKLQGQQGSASKQPQNSLETVPTPAKAPWETLPTTTPTKIPQTVDASPSSTITQLLNECLKGVDMGKNINDIKSYCKSRFSEVDVQKKIDDMLENGELFNTLDESTVALTPA